MFHQVLHTFCFLFSNPFLNVPTKHNINVLWRSIFIWAHFCFLDKNKTWILNYFLLLIWAIYKLMKLIYIFLFHVIFRVILLEVRDHNPDDIILFFVICFLYNWQTTILAFLFPLNLPNIIWLRMPRSLFFSHCEFLFSSVHW